MKRFWPLFTAAVLSTPAAITGLAGTLSYVAIPATQSDSNSGIGRKYGYTTAVDGGNSRGSDRIVNDITLYALSGAGQTSAVADNCTINALNGTLTDSGLTSKNIAADGSLRDVLSDMVLNNAGGDNSQVEIVLDPESLEEGSTYDLRVYICSSSGQNRQVNLAFFGDGQNGVETGFFNEDDARTSAGGFQNAKQVYYINYRYTWDGDSTPGITITQKFGGAPFCLYALTNELVFGGQSTAGAATGAESTEEGAGAEGGQEGETAGGDEAQAEGGSDEGLTAGQVDQESDEVGVESDDFYGSESLNSNGRWVKLSKWGTCWQPTNVAEGWAPYTNGSWKDCDDCGWTFVSDEPWAWACYHYGRWAKVSMGCGWAWVPGSVWAPSWVSWRQGRGESCNCVGWAPLPPEAGCRIGVGISSWVDSTCNIGPECYTFINIRDFGSDSYWGCGCMYDRGRNSTLIIDTFNSTNICWGRGTGIYCGGPDYNWCNTRIRQLGGKECGKIYVNRYDNPQKLGGKFARHEGNQLGLVSPRIRGGQNLKFHPKIAESAGADKIDHGWKGIKDKNQERKVRDHIAQENKGKNPRNSPAKFPPGVAEKMKQHGRGGKVAGQGGGAQGAGGLRPGGKGRKQGQGQMQGQNLQGGGAAGGDQHPGKGGRRRAQGQMAGGGQAGGQGAGAGGKAGGFDQHPGRKAGQNQARKARGGQMQAAGGGQQGGAGQQAAGGGMGRRHPGQSLKKGGQTASGGGAQGIGGGTTGSEGGQQKGRRGGKGANAQTAGGGQNAGGAQAGAGGQAQGGGGGGKRRQKGFAGAHAQSNAGQQLQGGQGQGQGGQAASTAGGARRAGGRHRQQQGGQAQAQGAGQGSASSGGGTAAAGGGGQGRGRKHQQQQTTQGGGQTQAAGGGGGQGRHRQQSQQQQQQQQLQQQQQARQQQLRQQQQQQQQQRGGGGKRRRGNQSPPPG